MLLTEKPEKIEHINSDCRRSDVSATVVFYFLSSLGALIELKLNMVNIL